uniref:Uncharacterized protein n=1 Tax=Arundo donax TaxID=35708 RepID=A0A0A9AY95_ARUDO
MYAQPTIFDRTTHTLPRNETVTTVGTFLPFPKKSSPSLINSFEDPLGKIQSHHMIDGSCRQNHPYHNESAGLIHQ